MRSFVIWRARAIVRGGRDESPRQKSRRDAGVAELQRCRPCAARSAFVGAFARIKAGVPPAPFAVRYVVQLSCLTGVPRARCEFQGGCSDAAALFVFVGTVLV